MDDDDNDKRRWWLGLDKSAAELKDHRNVIHVMDREADSYEMLRRLSSQGHRFVVRIPKDKRIHPLRRHRLAKLSFRATKVILRRPSSAIRTLPDSLEVHVVHVVEPDPPEDEAPVQWTLCTSEPIDTEAQVLQVVDMYRARWCIEEFFKALKTGCARETPVEKLLTAEVGWYACADAMAASSPSEQDTTYDQS